MNFLKSILGSLIRVVYQGVSQVIPTEPASISYFAIAIIVTTVIFKVLLLPLTLNQIKSQKQMAKIQPLQQELQKKYKSQPDVMQKKLQELYAEHKYNPMGGCLQMLIQLPIIFAFFGVMREPGLYLFQDPQVYAGIAKNFLWIPNLENPDAILWGLPLINAVSQYLYTKLTMTTQAPQGDNKQAAQMQSMNSMMLYMMPIMMFFFARSMSAGLILYWITSNLLEIFFRLTIKRGDPKPEEGVTK